MLTYNLSLCPDTPQQNPPRGRQQMRGKNMGFMVFSIPKGRGYPSKELLGA